MSAGDFVPSNAARGEPTAQDSIALAPFFTDPRFQRYYCETAQALQELSREKAAAYEVLEMLRQVFTGGRYSIANTETLRLVHEDAFLLYDIAAGKRPLSDLLAAIEAKASPDVFAAMLVDLHNFFRPRLVALTLALPPASEKSQ